MKYSGKSRQELLDIIKAKDAEIGRLKKSQKNHLKVEDQLRKGLEDSYQHQREFNDLLTGSKAVLEYKDFEPAARSIFNTCRDLIGATSGYVALLSEDGTENEVLFLDSGGLECSVDPDLPMPIRGLRGKAYETGKAVYENNFLKSPWMK